MRHLATLMSLVACLCVGGCASHPDYVQTRAADFADIFCVEATWGPGLEVHARATDFCGSGIGFSDMRGYGMYGRCVGRAARSEAGIVLLEFNLPGAFGLNTPFNYFESSATFGLPLEESDCFRAWENWLLPTGSFLLVVPFATHAEGVMSIPQMWENRWWRVLDMEAGAACLAGFHLGFSPGEFVDFLLGWTTYDFAGDDEFIYLRD